jgi:hypothetical protein
LLRAERPSTFDRAAEKTAFNRGVRPLRAAPPGTVPTIANTVPDGGKPAGTLAIQWVKSPNIDKVNE